MNVLVTGGAGYIGTALVADLAQRAEISEIRIYDNLSRKNPNLFLCDPIAHGKIRFIRADLLDTRKLQAALKGIDVVFHLAAKVSTPFADADFHGLDQVNHWGTAELSYLLENQPVSRVVYLSSTSVYGASESLVDLQTPPDPKTAYGISKLRGEDMLGRLNSQMPVHIVRCGNVYGYNKSMRFDAVINRLMLDAHFSGRLTIHGSGQQTRAFIHIQNLIPILSAIGLDGQLPGVSNVVERNATVQDIADVLQELYPDLEMLYIQQDMRLRNLMVEPDPRLAATQLLQDAPLREQLEVFRGQFAFEPQRP